MKRWRKHFLKNFLSEADGTWEERREKIKKRQEAQNKKTKEWKLNNVNGVEMKRRSHWMGESGPADPK